MPVQPRSRSELMAYAAAGMEPPPVVPLRKSDPRRAGPYRLESVLGSGGMGRVYLGRRTTGGAGLAAVKVVRPEYAEDPLFRKRFEREVSALDRVRGAHVVRLMGSGCEEDLVWVATEYIPGPTLAELVDERGPIGAAAAWRLLADVGRAIEAIWRAGIVHRDLKPSNVILGADGARVIDFGVVQAIDGTTLTATGQNVGTPAYMSPEQTRGRQVTAASDVFSLASTLTYAVAGEPPFGEGTGVDVLHRVAFDPPREETLDKVAAVDAELAAFIRTCLDKDPERRPTPETVFRTAIGHQLAAEGPLPTDPVPDLAPNPTPAKPNNRNKLILAAATTAAAVLVVGTLTAVLLRHGDDGTSAAPVAPAVTDNSPSPPPTSQPSPSSTPSRTGTPTESADSTGASPTQASKAPDLRSTACPAEITPGTGTAASTACVKELQRLLTGWGLYVPVDGKFGASTTAAVKAFETAAGATVDGKAGAYVKKLLYSAARGPVRTGALTVTESVNAVDIARCLEAGLGGAGLDVEVWGCAGRTAQQWALYRVPGRASEYLVVNRANHRCLDADSATTGHNGQRVRARTCDGLDAQRWRPGVGAGAGSGAGAASGGRTLVSVPDGFCLDAEAETSGQDGQPVQGWSCAGSVNQVWNWS